MISIQVLPLRKKNCKYFGTKDYDLGCISIKCNLEMKIKTIKFHRSRKVKMQTKFLSLTLEIGKKKLWITARGEVGVVAAEHDRGELDSKYKSMIEVNRTIKFIDTIVMELRYTKKLIQVTCENNWLFPSKSADDWTAGCWILSCGCRSTYPWDVYCAACSREPTNNWPVLGF